MTAREIVKSIMQAYKYSYATMSKKLKDKLSITSSSTNIYDRLNVSESRGKGLRDMRIDTLLPYLEVLDCELVIREKYSRKGEPRKEWIVESDSTGNARPGEPKSQKTHEDQQDATHKHFESVPQVHAVDAPKKKAGRYE